VIRLTAWQVHELADEMGRVQYTTSARSAVVDIAGTPVYVAYDEDGTDLIVWVADSAAAASQADLLGTLNAALHTAATPPAPSPGEHEA